MSCREMSLCSLELKYHDILLIFHGKPDNIVILFPPLMSSWLHRLIGETPLFEIYNSCSSKISAQKAVNLKFHLHGDPAEI